MYYQRVHFFVFVINVNIFFITDPVTGLPTELPSSVTPSSSSVPAFDEMTEEQILARLQAGLNQKNLRNEIPDEKLNEILNQKNRR